MKKIAIAFGITIAVIVIGAIVLLGNDGQPANAATLEGTKSPATYIGADECEDCHKPVYDKWELTAHASDFTVKDYHGSIINLYLQNSPNASQFLPGSCAKCHAVGYDEASLGGFNSSQAYNSSHNAKFLGIQCENCHGPGSDHPASAPANINGNPTIEDSCYGDTNSYCHGPAGHNNYYAESKHNTSLEAAGGTVATDPYCQKCHTREGFINFVEGTTTAISDPRKIDCSACHDPHEKNHERQLRMSEEELCAACHNNGYETAPGKDAEIHHPQAEINDGTGGVGVTMGTGMPGVACPDCHMYATPTVYKWTYNSGTGKWGRTSKAISEVNTTLVSYDTNRGHWFKPTAEACASCHSSLMSSLPSAYNESDSDLMEEWETWGPLWDAEVEKWQKVIDGWQEDFEERWAEVNETLAQTYTDLVAANATGEVDNASLAKAWDLYYKAKWNLEYVESDNSDGVHNFQYEMALLDKTEEYSETVGELIQIKAAAPPEKPTDYTAFFYVVIALLVISMLLSIVAIMRKPQAPMPQERVESPPKEQPKAPEGPKEG